jgi:thioesterase III
VETELTRWGQRSGVIRQVVKLKETGTVVADAEVTFVMYDTRKQTTALLEGDLLKMLQTI